MNKLYFERNSELAVSGAATSPQNVADKKQIIKDCDQIIVSTKDLLRTELLNAGFDKRQIRRILADEKQIKALIKDASISPKGRHVADIIISKIGMKERAEQAIMIFEKHSKVRQDELHAFAVKEAFLRGTGRQYE